MFFVVDLFKGKAISAYDGHRTTKDGKIQLRCPRMVDFLVRYPNLAKIPFSKTHLMSVPSDTRNVVIEGGASAHVSLQNMDNHGGIGTGSTINSSQRTGLKPNCKGVWILRRAHEHLKNMTGITFADGMYRDLVFYLTEDVKAGDQALYYYNCDSHPDLSEPHSAVVLSSAPAKEPPSAVVLSSAPAKEPPSAVVPSSAQPSVWS